MWTAGWEGFRLTGIVPDMAGGAAVSRHLGLHLLESSPIVLPADDDGMKAGRWRCHGHDPNSCLAAQQVVTFDPVAAAARWRRLP